MTNTLHQTDFSAQRTSFDQKILPWIEGFVRFIATHWLALMNTALAIFAGLPILSPILEASDSPALQSVGQAIFWGYQATCHQLPYRSFFILGHQVVGALGAYLGGAVFDSMGSYFGIFFPTALATFVGAGLVFLIREKKAF